MPGLQLAKLPLGEEEKEWLQTMATPLTFAANEVIFSEIEQARSVYCLVKGVVRLYNTLRDGRRRIVRFAVAGEFLVVPQSQCKPFSADALGDVVVNRYARPSFLQFMRSSPPLMREIVHLTTAELQSARERIVLLGYGSPKEKLLAFLLMWQQKLGKPSATEILLPMRRYDIADYLDLTFETVSRTLSKLEREQLIRVDQDRVQILDPVRAAELVRPINSGLAEAHSNVTSVASFKIKASSDDS